MNRSSLPLGVNKLKKWWDDENRVLRCDLPFQRHAGAWSPITKSNLVWSILADSYIPPIVLLKDKSGVDERGKDTFLYNIEDGQQRLTNLFSFMDDGWTLHGATPIVEFDGFEYDLAGKKFSELPEELQNAISQYRFSVQCLENYTMQEAEALFFNINSGVALSVVQKSKAKMGTDLIQFFSGLLEGGFFTQAINITEAQEQGLTPDSFRGFLNDFANQEHPAYDEASGSGNVKARSVQMRLRMMFLAFCRYFGLETGAVRKPFADAIPLDEGMQVMEPGEAVSSAEAVIPAGAESDGEAGAVQADGAACADVG